MRVFNVKMMWDLHEKREGFVFGAQCTQLTVVTGEHEDDPPVKKCSQSLLVFPSIFLRSAFLFSFTHSFIIYQVFFITVCLEYFPTPHRMQRHSKIKIALNHNGKKKVVNFVNILIIWTCRESLEILQ